MTISTASPIGVEHLDSPDCPADIARATLRDIAVANTLLGGRAAADWGLANLLRDVPPGRPLTLLDVGAGGGDIAAHVTRQAARRGHRLIPLLLDRHPAAAAMSRASGAPTFLADACRPPLAPGSVDLVLASQFLHHFSPAAAAGLLRQLDALARVGVVVADLRRTRLAAAGIWLVSFPLRFHPVTRRDGVTSVRRGFTAAELSRLLDQAGIRGNVSPRPGFRLVATWRVSRAND